MYTLSSERAEGLKFERVGFTKSCCVCDIGAVVVYHGFCVAGCF